jgi:hypothetical protein
MDDWVTVLLAIGIVLRLTRLITTDTITSPIRTRLPGKLYELATCAWCTSIWLAPVAASWWAWSHTAWWQITGIWLTASWIAGALSNAGQPTQIEVAPIAPLTIHTEHTGDDGGDA